MLRNRKSFKLDSRTARSKLPAHPKPVFVQIDRGLHLGYRKNSSGGRWVMRYKVGLGKYSVTTLANADDHLEADGSAVLDYYQAQKVAKERFAGLITPVNRDAKRYTVQHCLEDYFERLDHEGRSTVADYRSRAQALIYPALGDVLVAELTSDQLRAWLSDLAKSPRRRRSKNEGGRSTNDNASELTDPTQQQQRRASANRTLTILKAALNHAFREGHVANDQAWRRVPPFRGVDKARTDYLTAAEVKALTAANTDDFGVLIKAALHTGARYGELTRLRVDDLDTVAQTLRIRQSKSGKPRTIRLTAGGTDFFARLASERDGPDLLLTRADGEQWGASHQIRRMANALTSAGIQKPFSFHMLRHTYASHAVMNGMQMLVLARNLGHADTRMVERHYGHLSNDYQKAIIERSSLKF